MSADLPDFTKSGYQLRTELGQNHLGGRTTYLATNSQGYPVVIKQFQFATSGSSWGEYDAYQQEITMLRRLQHPGIPRYLDAFQTPDGFCMVQKYIPGESLATPRNWTPQEIKHIALATLEILTYLQSQHPPIIHRDIKPENILVDEQLKVYLVDFGFARMGGGEIAASSVVKGTMGFMPPEQLFNRKLTTASDLYGLGATLICLLTGTKSGDIGNLIDADYQIHFQHLVPPLKRGWINWLAKITAPKVTERYPSAAAALAALKPIDVDRLPKLIISHNSLQFTATKWQEKVSQTVTLRNPIPETLLAGQFSVAPHPSDPPHTPYDHAWISFDRATFEGNLVNCEMTVDTSKLLADTSYTREVLLDSNADGEPEVITVTVQTAPLPKPLSFAGWLGLLVVLGVSGFVGWGLAGNYELIIFPLIALVMTADRVAGAVARGIEVNVFTAFIGSCMLPALFMLLTAGSLGSDDRTSIPIIIVGIVLAFVGANFGKKHSVLGVLTLIIFAGFLGFLNFVLFLVCAVEEHDPCFFWEIIAVDLLAIFFQIFAKINPQKFSKYKFGINFLGKFYKIFPVFWLAAMMGLLLGAEAMNISEFIGKNTWDNFPILCYNHNLCSGGLIIIMGFFLGLCPGIFLVRFLLDHIKLNAYVTKYSKKQLSLINP